MYGDVEQLKKAIVRATHFLFDSGVMQHSGHGNFSARLDGDKMILTSKGRLTDLTTDDLALVSFDGVVSEGQLEPTTAEIVAMHAGAYRLREHVRSIIHTHSPHVTAFAVAHEPLPCAYESLLRFGVADAIPVADWAPRGSPESVAHITTQLREHPTVTAVLLANHGLLAFGGDPLQAAQLIIALEEAAQVTLAARALGGEKPFPPGALAWERERMARFGAANQVRRASGGRSG